MAALDVRREVEGRDTDIGGVQAVGSLEVRGLRVEENNIARPLDQNPRTSYQD